MSSGKTEALGLNQWVLSDAFLMEEFNEDNRKIDKAVGANPCVKLLDVTLQSESAAVELDLSGIDLSKYASLQLYQRGTGTSITTMYLRLNNLTSDYSYLYGNNWQSGSSYIFGAYGSMIELQLTPNGVYSRSIDDIYRLSPTLLPADLKTLNLHRTSGTYPVGSRFVLQGVKL